MGNGKAMEPPKKPRFKRICLYWVIALALLIGSALVGWYLVVPIVSVRMGMARWHSDTFAFTDESTRQAIERLGGREEAARRLWIYINTPETLAPHRELAVFLMSKCDAEHIPKLLSLLPHQDADVRCGMVTALSTTYDPRTVETFIGLLLDTDENTDVRYAAASALGRFGGPEAVGALVATLRTGDADLRAQAARSLGEIGDPRAVQALETALRDESEMVRKDAARALEEIRDAAQPAAAAEKQGELKQ